MIGIDITVLPIVIGLIVTIVIFATHFNPHSPSKRRSPLQRVHHSPSSSLVLLDTLDPRLCSLAQHTPSHASPSPLTPKTSIAMPPRSRYAVDPSLTAAAVPQPGYQQQQPYPSPPTQAPQLHQVSDRRPAAPTGPYAPPSLHDQSRVTPQPPSQSYLQSQQPHPQPQRSHPSLTPPPNHIPPPPHSAGPALSGPRVRIDPSQMPNPIEAQEMDQNLWDDEDFMSCDTKGVIPLAGTDWRGVDQGKMIPRGSQRLMFEFTAHCR